MSLICLSWSLFLFSRKLAKHFLRGSFQSRPSLSFLDVLSPVGRVLCLPWPRSGKRVERVSRGSVTEWLFFFSQVIQRSLKVAIQHVYRLHLIPWLHVCLQAHRRLSALAVSQRSMGGRRQDCAEGWLHRRPGHCDQGAERDERVTLCSRTRPKGTGLDALCTFGKHGRQVYQSQLPVPWSVWDRSIIHGCFVPCSPPGPGVND